MKILKIETIEMEEPSIVITLEGYPHAQPVFNANISATELKTKLAEWKINQDLVDAENEATKAQPKIEPEVKAELKALEGKEIE